MKGVTVMLKNSKMLLMVGLLLTLALANLMPGQAAQITTTSDGAAAVVAVGTPSPLSGPPQPPPPPGGKAQDRGGDIATLSGHFVDIPKLGKTDFLLLAENPGAYPSPDVVRTHLHEVKQDGMVWEIPLKTGEFYGLASGQARVVFLDWYNPQLWPQYGLGGREYRFLGYLVWEAGVGSSLVDVRVPLGASGYVVPLDGTGGRAYYMPADVGETFDAAWHNPGLGDELFGQGSKESGWWFNAQRTQQAPDHLYGGWALAYWTWYKNGTAPSAEVLKMAAFYSRLMRENDYPKWNQFWRDYVSSGVHTWRTRAE